MGCDKLDTIHGYYLNTYSFELFLLFKIYCTILNGLLLLSICSTFCMHMDPFLRRSVEALGFGLPKAWKDLIGKHVVPIKGPLNMEEE